MLASRTYETQWQGLVQAAETIADQSADGLAGLRRSALTAFENHGVPTPKHEEWKYTPLREIAGINWKLAEPGPAVFSFEPTRFCDSVRVVIVNGRFDRNLSQIPAQSGVTVASLRDVLSEGQTCGQSVDLGSFPFAALNTALFQDGVTISLDEGIEAAEPIEILHISVGDNELVAPRVVVSVAANAKVKIVEQYLSDGTGSTLTIPVTEVALGEGAEVEHVRVQDEATHCTHIGLWQTTLAASSSYSSYNIAFGAGLGRLDQNIVLEGENIHVRLDGVVVASGAQTLDNHTKLDHALPNCNSFEVYKQIVGDEATVVFNGKIFVHQDAQKTDAKQTNQALLLSPKATINSKPQLEIFADDVKCTHGATVGQLEDTPLFYMRSRGLPKDQAQAMLVYAFAAEVLELIDVPGVTEKLESRLFTKLGMSQEE